MIASLEGNILQIEKDSLVLGVGGVGLRVAVPKTVLENVGGIGRNLFLFTHLVVRDTGLTLFGFETRDDLQLFEVLISVNGVGPKMGLAILSTLSPEMLRSAIMQEETVILQRVPGIGKKTAERMMFSLRDKLDFSKDALAAPLVSDVDADVIDVLTTLGFSIVEAQSALQKVPRSISAIDERVAAALKHLDQA